MICSATLTILKPDGNPLEGVTVSAFVRGTATPITSDTDANGLAQFSLQSETSVRFECSECAELSGKTVQIPKTNTLNIGTFTSDAQSEGVESGSGIESVVAGEGIDVDDTDPLNPIISVTGIDDGELS